MKILVTPRCGFVLLKKAQVAVDEREPLRMPAFALRLGVPRQVCKPEVDQRLIGPGTGRNYRNGTTRKTVSTISGPVKIEVPRDRNGSFEQAIVPKRASRLGNIDDMLLSLYSRGMTTRDIEAHLREIYGVNASRKLISNVADVVAGEIKAWQSRPLDEVYPILYVDGIRLRVQDNEVLGEDPH